MSTVWTVQRILNWTIEFFEKKQLPDARLSAELLLAHVLKIPRLELYLQFERMLTPAEREQYKQLIQRRSRREPLQYILGQAEFYGLTFRVTPEVLIPRPETELLVDIIIEHFRLFPVNNPNILDVGTGSGCIAIAIKKHLPQACVTAVDVSEPALEIARQNARTHGTEIQWIKGDGIAFLTTTKTVFHAIVSNPPYIGERELNSLQPEVRAFEPRLALVSGPTGLEFYQQMIPVAKHRLADRGVLVMELGYQQDQAVGEILRNQGFRYEMRQDYQQINRVVIGYHE